MDPELSPESASKPSATAESSVPPAVIESSLPPPSLERPSFQDLARAVLRAGELGVQAWNARRRSDGERPNLDRIELADAELAHIDLSRSMLFGANLRGAKLSGANLENADLRGANLADAVLSDACLRGARLDGANLLGAHLERVDMSGASLVGARLQCVNLRKARLFQAKLTQADLRWARLVDADLRSAELGEALTDPCDFAGCDCAGAQFSPAALEEFDETIARAEAAGAHPRATFAAVVAFCIFSALTAATASPISLVTRQGSVKIPIVDSDVTVRSFFFVSPVIAFGLLIYLVIHLAQVRSLMLALPLRMPDGRPALGQLSPWLQAVAPARVLTEPNTYAAADEKPWSPLLLGTVTRWMVPATATFMLYFFIQARRAIDLWLYFGLVIALWVLSALMWRREDGKSPPVYRVAAVAFSLIPAAVAIAFVTRVRQAPDATGDGALQSDVGFSLQTPFPMHARGKDLSSDLLEHLNLAGSDFSSAHFQGAALADVDLRGALLLSTDFKEIGARCVNLHGARLHAANFTGATLSCVVFSRAQGDAIFSEATLFDVDLRAADLSGAQFSTTHFNRVLCDSETKWPAGFTPDKSHLACPSDAAALNEFRSRCARCGFD